MKYPTCSSPRVCNQPANWHNMDIYIYIYHDLTNIKNERFQWSQCVKPYMKSIYNLQVVWFQMPWVWGKHPGTPHSTQVGQTRLGLHHAELCQICQLAPRHRYPTTWLSVTQPRTGPGIPKTSRLQVWNPSLFVILKCNNLHRLNQPILQGTCGCTSKGNVSPDCTMLHGSERWIW